MKLKYYNKKLKKTYKKRKRTNTTKRRRSRKMFYKFRGGQTDNAEIIGQGTHGIIQVDPQDDKIVIKSYHKLNIKMCENLENEYLIQKRLHKELHNSMITIPDCFEFEENKNNCSYKMDRIFPIPNVGKMLLVTMDNAHVSPTSFAHSSSVQVMNATQICETVDCNALDLAHSVGQMFSQMHFIMNIDGYDCELFCGVLPKISSSPKFILIDYDKVNSFKWELGTTVYRKIDEETIDEKHLKNVSKFAWFLYMAMASMSLVPTEKRMFDKFMEGYRTYSKTELQKEIIEEIENIHLSVIS